MTLFCSYCIIIIINFKKERTTEDFSCADVPFYRGNLSIRPFHLKGRLSDASEQRSRASGRNGSRLSCKYVAHRNVGGKEDLEGPPCRLGSRVTPFWGLMDERALLYIVTLYKQMQKVQCLCWSGTICAWIFKALGWESFNAAIKSRTFAEDPDIRSGHIETRTQWPGMNKNMEGPEKVSRICLTWLSLQLFGETVVMWGPGVAFGFRSLLANDGFGVTMQSFLLNAMILIADLGWCLHPLPSASLL